LGLAVLRRTFLRKEISTRLDFAQLAIELGGRGKDWARCFERLCKLGVLTWNQSEGIVQPTVDMQALSRERASRADRSQTLCKPNDALPLRGERFLDDALADVNREAALASNPRPPGGSATFNATEFLNDLRSALDSGSVEDLARKHPPPPATVTSSSSASLAIASALCTKASAKLKADDGDPPETVTKAWHRLEAVDRSGARSNPRFASQWQDVCRKNPKGVLSLIDYVTPKLAAKLPDGSWMIANPWAYMANMARSADWRLMT